MQVHVHIRRHMDIEMRTCTHTHTDIGMVYFAEIAAKICTSKSEHKAKISPKGFLELTALGIAATTAVTTSDLAFGGASDSASGLQGTTHLEAWGLAVRGRASVAASRRTPLHLSNAAKCSA